MKDFETIGDIIYSNQDAKLTKLDWNLKEPFKGRLLLELESLSFIHEFGRNTAWLGEEGLNYPYANKDHLATGWTARTKILTNALHDRLGEEFNHLLVNQYLPGQKLNPHKDDEPELKGAIASLSLGDTATFDFTAGNIDLHDGDFIIGNRKFFNQLKHSISISHNNEIRYNLTWRNVTHEPIEEYDTIRPR